MIIPTAAEYIRQRRRERPEGVTLAEFNEAYPANELISEWRQSLWQMFVSAERDGDQVRPCVLRSMEQQMGEEEAYKSATQLAKHRPSVFPHQWWVHMAAWRKEDGKKAQPYRMLRRRVTA